MNSYHIEVAPREGINVDRIVFATCHRTAAFFTEELEDVDLPFFKKHFGKKRRGKEWTYTPTPGIEDTGNCDLYIFAMDYEDARDHSFAVLRFENQRYKLNAKVYCDGDGGKDRKGVSVCDAKEGTIQQVKYDKPVQIRVRPKQCPIPKRKASGAYQWAMGLGKCDYLATTKDLVGHSMVTYGWKVFRFERDDPK